MYIYICMHIRIHIDLYTRTYTYKNTQKHAHTCTHSHTHAYTHIHTHTHPHRRRTAHLHHRWGQSKETREMAELSLRSACAQDSHMQHHEELTPDTVRVLKYMCVIYCLYIYIHIHMYLYEYICI